MAKIKEKILQISPSLIQLNPFKPRKNFNLGELEELKNSIKIHGIIQPLIVSELGEGHYQLIAGERRLKASQLLGLEKVPVVVREDVDDNQRLELSLIENIQRKDLSPLEKALAYKKLAEEFNLSHQVIADRLGKARPTISNTIRLLNLPEEIKKSLSEGIITETHCKIILGYKTEYEQLKFFYKITASNLPAYKALRDIQEERKVAQFDPEPYKRSNIFTTPLTKTITNDFDIREKEEKLREILGTRVDISKSGQAGKIIIEFYSEEELKNIIDKICSMDSF